MSEFKNVYTWRAGCWVSVSPRRIVRPFRLVDCISNFKYYTRTK